MSLAPGERLGPYEVVAPLGAGGMGEVWRARDTRLGRDVAIKVLAAEGAGDLKALSRFQQEARSVAALSHPNILEIFDIGEERGVPFAVTELLDGESLRARLRGGPLSVAEALSCARQITAGLAAAHAKGIVHRDLKPENLFVTKDGILKILDFGLARRVIPSAGNDTENETEERLTGPGSVVGTVGYMSPEQARGLPVDHRSDLFSFGAVLYELLSGASAFRRASNADTLSAILNEEPPPLEESGRPVPAELDRVVRHCLEKRPEKRFQSAHDVALALEDVNEASRPSRAMPVARATLPRRNPALLAGIAVVLLVAAGAFVVWRSRNAGTPATGAVKRIAVLPFENLGPADDDYFADGIADEVRGKLTAVPGLEVIARTSSNIYRKSPKPLKEIAEELGVRYLLSATVRRQKEASRLRISPELVEVTSAPGPASRWQQQFETAVDDVLQVQSDLATRVVEQLGVALGAGTEKRLTDKPTRNLAAYEAFLRGQKVASELMNDPSAGRQALSFFEQTVALDAAFAEAWAALSAIASKLYYNQVHDPALVGRAREAAERALALAPGRPEPYLALGLYHTLVAGDPRRGFEFLRTGLGVAPGDVRLLAEIGSTERNLGRWDEALGHLRQVLRLDPKSRGAMFTMGMTLAWMRRFPEARQLVERALAMNPSDLNTIVELAQIHIGEGDLQGARSVLRAVPKEVSPVELVVYVTRYYGAFILDDEQRDLLLRLPPSAFGDDRGQRAACLADACALKGDEEGKRRYAEEARESYAAKVAANPNEPVLHVQLGVALAALGRGAEAIQEGERGLSLKPRSVDAWSASFSEASVAEIYSVVGEHEKALDLLEVILRSPGVLSAGSITLIPEFAPLRSYPRYRKLIEQGR